MLTHYVYPRSQLVCASLNTEQTLKHDVTFKVSVVLNVHSHYPQSWFHLELIQDFIFIATADGTLFPPTYNPFYCYTDMRLQTEEPVPESHNL